MIKRKSPSPVGVTLSPIPEQSKAPIMGKKVITRKKYADGTKGVKTQKAGQDREVAAPSIPQIPVSSDPKNPAFIGPPAPEDTSLDSLGDNPVDSLPKGSLSPSSTTGLAKGGTQAVAALQAKYNAQGANLKVDGAWGPKTQAAFEQFQASQKKGSTIPKVSLPKGDQEFKSLATPKGSLGKSYRELADFYDKGIPKVVSPPTAKASPIKRKVTSPEYDPSFDEAQDPGATTQDAYAGIKYPEATSPKGEVSKVGAGRQFYANGRVKTPSGKMDTYSKLPKGGQDKWAPIRSTQQQALKVRAAYTSLTSEEKKGEKGTQLQAQYASLQKELKGAAL